MDYTTSTHNENGSEPFSLVYPLAVEFDKRAPRVNVETLVFGVLNPLHLREPKRKLRENDIFLFKRTVSMDWKHNLYILINSKEESYNVNFTTILLRQAFEVNRSIKKYSERKTFYQGAYRDCYHTNSGDDAEKKLSKRDKCTKLNEKNTRKRPAFSIYPDSEFVRRQQHYGDDAPVSIKLTLALANVESSMTSLYEFSSLFGHRFDYEGHQHNTVSATGNLANNLPDHHYQSIADESNLKFKRLSNLYVCSFDNRYDFQTALDYLTNNCANWNDIYDIPVGLDDDCIRFSLDMFIRNMQFENEIQRRQRRYELISGNGLKSSVLTQLSHLKMDSPSILANEYVTCETDDDFAAEVLLERAFASGFKCNTPVSSSEKAEQSSNQRENSRQKIDIFACFSMANWSVYNNVNHLITSVDRDAFERLLIKSNTAFFQSLETPFPKKRLDQLYDTPLLFVPSIIWDLETIALNPCTVPRGVAGDESLVSIALVMQRPAIDLFRLAMVWVLVPNSLDRSERENIAKQSLLRVEHEHNLHQPPTLICYTDEQAMLYDFCALMTINFPILYTYGNISLSHLPAYRDLCTFLIGHNSIGYDYTFILNRCIYFGFDDLRVHLTRKMNNYTANGMSALYTFNDAQICIDTLCFLRTRMRHLSAFDLQSVLRFYDCEITKINLDAVQIRHFYNTLHTLSNKSKQNSAYPLTTHKHYAAISKKARLPYFTEFLRYNLFDCLSLCDLLEKLSFMQYITTVMRTFSVPLESALYRGNSRLLPSLLINDCLREKREFLVPGHENQSIFSVDKGGVSFVEEFRSWLAGRSERLSSALSIRIEYQPLFDYFSPIPSHHLHHIYNPYVEFVEYMRTLCWENSLDEPESDNSHLMNNHSASAQNPSAFHENLSWSLENELNRFHSFNTFALPCERQLDLLRIGEKTYVGGMNYADPCHVKHPILMDYNSFYPSIIRHYQLDVNNVAIFTVKKLLLAIRPIVLLEQIIQCGVFRIFDYTALQDVDIYVNKAIFSSPHFHAIFKPKPHCRREWHEGIEIDSLDLLLASSKSLERRVLVLIKKIDHSVIDRVVTEALLRRETWKKKKRENPNDKIIQSRELMDKLLANGTYGYLNYGKSVIFSRATASAVTLLCRNAFCKTRFIIESDALLSSLNLDPNRLAARVIYIDTDGCIVFIQKKTAFFPDNHPGQKTAMFNIKSKIANKANSLRISLPLLDIFNTPEQRIASSPSKVILDANRDLPLLSINKDVFVKKINAFLNMQHVTLAAEHHNAIAASVFATKKYALYKIDSLCPPKEVIKKTGFESNAAVPIKALYDVVLRNIALLNHGYDFVLSQRFICKITQHRAFFYAIFDKLYAGWQSALAAHRLQKKRQYYSLSDNPHNADEADYPGDNEPTEMPGSRYKLADFASRIPLNPKENKGKLSEFIDSVLNKFQYNIGDRVSVIKLAAIDANQSITINTPSGAYMLYDLTDSQFELFDIARQNIEQVLPDFKYLLGGHATYLYQCIEGCQSLRDRSSIQKEPVAWANAEAFICHLRTMEQEGYVSPVGDPLSTSIDKSDISQPAPQNTLYLRTFNAIYDLHYATWLWQRILSKRIESRFHDRVLLHWNSHVKMNIKKMTQDLVDGNLLASDMISKEIPCVPPKILSFSFFKKWLTRDNDAFDRLVFDALFCEPSQMANAKDIAVKRQLIGSGFILYKAL